MTELTPEETDNPLGGYGRTISHIIIGLKTTKGSKQLRLDPSIYDSLQKEKVNVGDVIYIESNSGAVKRVGRPRETFTRRRRSCRMSLFMISTSLMHVLKADKIFFLWLDNLPSLRKRRSPKS